MAKAARLQDIFGRDNLFVELQDHGLADQRRTNPQLIEIARRLGAPLLATNDSHYTHREDPSPTTPCCACRPGAPIDDPNRFKFEGDQHYLKSAAEMRAAVRRGARGVRQHALDRRAGRRRDRVRQARAARASRCPRASPPTTPYLRARSPSRAPGER